MNHDVFGISAVVEPGVLSSTGVRIHKIEFTHFRNIEHGVIEFPNSDRDWTIQGAPSIIGLYGQNGSGKSSVIMALDILKTVLSGKNLQDRYKSCIQYGYESCALSFSFSMGSITQLDGASSFDASLNAIVKYDFEIFKSSESVLKIQNEVIRYQISVGNELICPSQVFVQTCGGKQKLFKNFFGSKEKAMRFGSPELYSQLCYVDNDNKNKHSKSLIFDDGVFSLMSKKYDPIWNKIEMLIPITTEGLKLIAADKEGEFEAFYDSNKETYAFLQNELYYSLICSYLKYLRAYSINFLFVFDTATTGWTMINQELPILLWERDQAPFLSIHPKYIPLNMTGPTDIPRTKWDDAKRSFQHVVDVLEKIVPSVKLTLKEEPITKNDIEYYSVNIFSIRGNSTIPLAYESDGIRRIVSILSLLIAAYNDASVTVAIDEIDVGLFEYLLGEILAVLGDSMKGQLVFTAHNLRPLEVLPSKFICFTSTNPKKRFIKIPVRGNSNLRDTYLRSVVLNTQKEEVYRPTNRYEIERAFYLAGHDEETDT